MFWTDEDMNIFGMNYEVWTDIKRWEIERKLGEVKR